MSYKEVTAGWVAGRLLLFIGRNDEADNADDNKCVLKQFTICDHWAAPLIYMIQRAEAAPCCKRANRVPLQAALKDDSFLSSFYHSSRQDATTILI